MFANRFTAFVDACSLVSALKRILLLSLAEAEFFRLRWSSQVLDETEAAIAEILDGKGVADATARAKRARSLMEATFEDAMVADFDNFLPAAAHIPDPDDRHVVAAAVKTKAAMIVTENLKDFPADVLSRLNMEAKSADTFIADTIALDEARAVAAIRRMRERRGRPASAGRALYDYARADKSQLRYHLPINFGFPNSFDPSALLVRTRLRCYAARGK